MVEPIGLVRVVRLNRPEAMNAVDRDLARVLGATFAQLNADESVRAIVLTTPRVIATVNGPALGEGFELALACDLVVADEHAWFALPEVSRGLFAAAGGLLRLGQRLQPSIATELVLTGRRLPADEAAQWGLVNRAAPSGTALEAALDLAQSIAEHAPLAVRTSKRLLQDGMTAPVGEPSSWRANDEAVKVVFASDDAAEGAGAFAEKRPPAWTGR